MIYTCPVCGAEEWVIEFTCKESLELEVICRNCNVWVGNLDQTVKIAH